MQIPLQISAGRYPYEIWCIQNAIRTPGTEDELIDTGVFDEERYFDVIAEYAKARRKTF